MTDPVQSIRVADALAQRFRALLQSGAATASELELAIGESQQIYPEIWRHLDEARTVLAARGVDVSAYDYLRQHEQGHLGVTGVDVSANLGVSAGILLATGVLMNTTTKSATFNNAG